MTIEVKKLPLGRYSELIKCLKELPQKVGGLDKLSSDEIFQRLPAIIAEAWPEVVNMLSIATDVKAEELNQLGLDDAVTLVEAVFEVNNYQAVIEKVKKMLARPVEVKAIA